VLSPCAGAFIGLGRLPDALLLAERAVAMSPDHASPRFVLGSALARLGRSDEAIAQLDTVERLAPNTIWAHRSLIWRSVVHLLAGRCEQALEASERSLPLVLGPDPLIQNMLCLTKLDRWPLAAAALDRLRESDPKMSWRLVERLVHHIYDGSNTTGRTPSTNTSRSRAGSGTRPRAGRRSHDARHLPLLHPARTKRSPSASPRLSRLRACRSGGTPRRCASPRRSRLRVFRRSRTSSYVRVRPPTKGRFPSVDAPFSASREFGWF
jgi:tetratricopeptide (TPR) repeat protein